MNYVVKKILTAGLAFAMAFTLIPASFGSLEADAASAPARVSGLKVSTNGKTAVTIKWNKVKKNLNGYTIYRNGKEIKSVGKATASFSDKNIKAGTNYTYYVKAYRNVKQKQWYNKATRKWQVKKPAKKIRGKSKKVTVKLYGKASPSYTVKTQKPAASASSSKTTKTSYAIAISKTDKTAAFTLKEIEGNPIVNVYIRGNKKGSVSKSSPTLTVTGLEPYTEYDCEFRLEINKEEKDIRFESFKTNTDIVISGLDVKENELLWSASGSIEKIQIAKNGKEEINIINDNIDKNASSYDFKLENGEKPIYYLLIHGEHGEKEIVKYDFTGDTIRITRE